MKVFLLTSQFILELGQTIRLWGFRPFSDDFKLEPVQFTYSPSELHQKIISNREQMLQTKEYPSFEEANREAKSRCEKKGKDRAAIVEVEIEAKPLEPFSVSQIVKVISISNENKKILLDPAAIRAAALAASAKSSSSFFSFLRSGNVAVGIELTGVAKEQKSYRSFNV